MSKKRNRITVKDCYRNLPKLSDSAKVVSQNLFKMFVNATGETVLVSASSPDIAIYALSSWLSSVGLDSRVMFLESFDKSEVLSSQLLYNNACANRKDETLF